jgi:hypothetical protein
LVCSAGTNGFRYRGNWGNPPLDNPSVPYALNDVVNYIVGGETQTYVAVEPVVPPHHWDIAPPSTSWNLMFSAPTTAYGWNVVTGKIYTEADFVGVSSDGQYQGITTAGTTTVTFTEFTISDPAVGHGIAVLKFSQFARWLGSVTIALPSTSSSPTPATVNWLASDTVLSVANAGTVTSYGTHPSANITGPATEVPGFVMNGTVAGSRIRQWDDPLGGRITITNPARQACNIYAALIGFRVY